MVLCNVHTYGKMSHRFLRQKFPSYKDKQRQGKSYAFIDIQPPTLSGSKEYVGTDTGLPTYSEESAMVTTVTASLSAQVVFPAPQAIA